MTQHTLSPDRIAQLVTPYFSGTELAPANLYEQLAAYLDLLLKWNARTNLTAIREPEEIVRRHFGESLFAAQRLGIGGTLLDFGSGAGFPGLPIQLVSPQRPVTLAESQNKKASFLREVVRSLGLKTEVWASRVESMPASRTFDVVVLRAVDNMEDAILAASQRASQRLAIMMSAHHAVPAVPGFSLTEELPQPGDNPLKIALLDRTGED